MNKSPAFQFYPDKAKAGTAHLTDEAFRAYWEIIWWMWLHGKDQCKMPDTDFAWCAATGLRIGKKLDSVRDEIMHETFPLFKRQRGFLVSNALKKEIKKQKNRRKQAREAGKASAKAKKDRALSANEAATSVAKPLHTPTSSPVPTPAPATQKKKTPLPPRRVGGSLPLSEEEYRKYPLLRKLHECEAMRHLTKENYLTAHRCRNPYMNFEKATDAAILAAELKVQVNSPGELLNYHWRKYEENNRAETDRRTKIIQERESAITDMVAFIAEMRDNPERLDRAKRDFEKDYGKDALKEAERKANG
jgi:uncharacterized protein YdaU (DUF1376 family)